MRKMYNFVIDASAWIEYLDGTSKGEKVKEFVENGDYSVFTNAVTLAELSSFFRRKKYNFEEAKKIILSLSTVNEIDVKFAEDAGNFHAELKSERKSISLADAFVFATAKKVNGKIITQDEDFRGLKETIMIR